MFRQLMTRRTAALAFTPRIERVRIAFSFSTQAPVWCPTAPVSRGEEHSGEERITKGVLESPVPKGGQELTEDIIRRGVLKALSQAQAERDIEKSRVQAERDVEESRVQAERDLLKFRSFLFKCGMFMVFLAILLACKITSTLVVMYMDYKRSRLLASEEKALETIHARKA